MDNLNMTVFSLASSALDKGSPRRDICRMALVGLASRPEKYVVAIDFDGTLHYGTWPEIGEPNKELLERALLARKCGVQLVLWTCREGDTLKEAVDWCWERGLEFDALNDNIEERKALYGNNPRKIGYDELWDDRAIPIDARTWDVLCGFRMP